MSLEGEIQNTESPVVFVYRGMTSSEETTHTGTTAPPSCTPTLGNCAEVSNQVCYLGYRAFDYGSLSRLSIMIERVLPSK